jgi:hypothetical protein
MRGVLLGLAASIVAVAIPVAPAEAQEQGFVSRPPKSFHGDFAFRHGDFDRRDRRRHRDDGTVFVYDRDWQGDSAWRPESFNDWWHERPARSYPAWVQRNQDCQRKYWSGGGWRC